MDSAVVSFGYAKGTWRFYSTKTGGLMDDHMGLSRKVNEGKGALQRGKRAVGPGIYIVEIWGSIGMPEVLHS